MQINDFLNKHEGKLAFVIGSGPSLHFEKLDGIENYVTFAVNTGLLKHRAADYFVTNGGGAAEWDYFLNALPKIRGTSFLPADPLAVYSDRFNPAKSCFYDHKYTFDLQARKIHESSYVLSRSEPIVGVGSASSSAIHIAYLMGCNPIILLGADCSYINDHNYFWQFPGEAKPKRIKGIIPPTRKYLMRNKSYDDHNREMLEHWATFGRCNPHVNVINATNQGLLDCFPKMPYADVIGRFGALTRQ